MARGKVTLEQKQAEVTELATIFKESGTVVVIDSLGLTVEEVTGLRKQIRESGSSMRVVKNTMLRRAAEEAGIEIDAEMFIGPSAIVYSDDVVAPAKILVDYDKDNKEKITIKGGIVEAEAASVDTIKAVASLPGREDLYSMLASALQGPIRKTAQVFKAMSPAQKLVYALSDLAGKGDAA